MSTFHSKLLCGLVALALLTRWCEAAAQNTEQRPQSTLMAAVTIPVAGPSAYRVLATETEAVLQDDVLLKWFPAAVDREHGGFHQNFAQDWKRLPPNDRSVVYQSRLTWMAAQVAQRYPARAARYRQAARHGLDFLAKTMWDKAHGGFFWALNNKGVPDRNGEKHAYGISFAIYAASASYHATKDARALDLARRAYVWLDGHAHDKVNGGYYEALSRQGRPILVPPADKSQPQSDFIGTRYGYKSMNTHIHLLEALTSLHQVWPDTRLRTRLQEIFRIVSDQIVVERAGAMNLYFTPDWKAIPDHDSFGHDVETAYLLVEAAAELGKPNDARTWEMARRLVDHALQWGWDSQNGGFYDAGPTFGAATNTSKIWWVQAEGLNALLMLHQRFGRQTPRYWQAFNQQWNWIKKYQIDATNGGWHPEVTREGAATPGRQKSDSWTEAYHQGRALLNVSATLRHLANTSGQ